MRNTRGLSSELDGILRLVLITVAGMIAGFVWCVRSAQGARRESLIAAFCVSLMPLCIAFPRLFRKSRANSDDTLSQLRNAGAI